MISNEQNAGTNKNLSISCPVCGKYLGFQITRGRKSGKPSLMLKCFQDGRHFRGFICDRDYMQQLLERIEESHKIADQAHR